MVNCHEMNPRASLALCCTFHERDWIRMTRYHCLLAQAAPLLRELEEL